MVDSIDRSPLLAGKHSTPLLPNCYTTVFQCSSTRVLQNPSNPASPCSSTPVDHLRCVEFSSVACQSCLQIEQRHDSSRLLQILASASQNEPRTHRVPAGRNQFTSHAHLRVPKSVRLRCGSNALSPIIGNHWKLNN